MTPPNLFPRSATNRRAVLFLLLIESAGHELVMLGPKSVEAEVSIVAMTHIVALIVFGMMSYEGDKP